MEDIRELKGYKDELMRKLVKAGYAKQDLVFTGVKHGSRRATQARAAIAYMVMRRGLVIGLTVTEISKVIGCSYNYALNCYYTGQEARRGYNMPTLRRIIEILGE